MQILVTLAGMAIGLGLIVFGMNASPAWRLGLLALVLVVMASASVWLAIAAARHEREFRAIIRASEPDLDEAAVRKQAREIMRATRIEPY